MCVEGIVALAVIDDDDDDADAEKEKEEKRGKVSLAINYPHTLAVFSSEQMFGVAGSFDR